MAILVDDAAGAVLGPWGLAVGAGIGIALLARKRLAPAAGTVAVGGVAAGERARDWIAELGVTDRARAIVAELSDWWGDLYAEARSEWEASRNAAEASAGAAGATAVATPPRRRSPDRARTGADAARSRSASGSNRSANPRPKRPRGPDGRFLRRSEE